MRKTSLIIGTSKKQANNEAKQTTVSVQHGV